MKVRNARLTGALVAGLTGTLVVSSLVGASASSHREAPLITEDPVSDNTDTYAFVAPDDPDTDFDEADYVTLIANWIPLEEPASGPNFHSFGDDVLYAIHVDNDGDAVEDVTYEWRFRTEDNTDPRTPGDFLYNTGTITVEGDGYSDDWKLPQFYTLTKVDADGNRTTLFEDAPTPPVNIGPRSTPNYDQLAQVAVRVNDPEVLAGVPLVSAVLDTPPLAISFAGQRDEVFNVDLGSIFDLGGLRPLNEAHAAPLPSEPGVDTTSGYNVHTIALQVPKTEVTGDGNGNIGVWSTTSRKKTRVFTGNNGAQLQHAGPWVQVSRLGSPLVNELVVPYSLKDVFNASAPVDDAQFAEAVMQPTLDDLFASLYPLDAECFDQFNGEPVAVDGNRPDIVSVFLTGLPGVNQLDTVTPSEMLRLNTTIAPTPFGDANPLGVAAGDNAGFPNGRRPLDDTVDASLLVTAGFLAGCADTAPNNAVTDGVPTGEGNDLGLATSFPYLPNPHQGYDHLHDHSNS